MSKVNYQDNYVFIVFDSIKSTVFAGQVLQPIIEKLEQNKDLKIHLISFEREKLNQEEISAIIPKRKNFNFIELKRFPFLNKLSLIYQVFLLKEFLKKFNNYSIKARGPFAGWLALKSLDKNKCKSLTIQARGLGVHEYFDLIYPNLSGLKKLLHNYRRKEHEKIEREAYNPKNLPNNFCNNFYIESITPALSDYLVNNYKAEKNYIKIACEDFPKKIDLDQKNLWREQIRKKLNISLNTHVYCYNGSSLPWQSLDLTIDFFKNNLQDNKNIFLLILTQNKQDFANLLKQEKIDSKYYKILNINHSQIYKYLSACDTGLVFRKEHLANWISRPIKAMEYQAVGLNIIHNNTVKWLIDLDREKII